MSRPWLFSALATADITHLRTSPAIRRRENSRSASASSGHKAMVMAIGLLTVKKSCPRKGSLTTPSKSRHCCGSMVIVCPVAAIVVSIMPPNT